MGVTLGADDTRGDHINSQGTRKIHVHRLS